MKFRYYQVVFAQSAADLRIEVEGNLILEWSLVGGVSVAPTHNQGEYMWAQAMAKEQ